MKTTHLIQILIAIFITAVLIVIVTIARKRPSPRDYFPSFPKTADEIKLPPDYPNIGKG